MVDWRSLVSGGAAAGGVPIQRGGITLPRSPGGPRQIQQKYANSQYGLGRFAGGYLPSLIENYANQANQDRFSGEGRDAFLAPRLTAIDDAQRGAAGALTQDLTARGLDDSSAMASGLGNLYAAGAGARANAVSGLYDAEQQRQQQAQGNLAQLLAQITGYGGNAANTAGNMRNQDLQQSEFDRSGAFDWGSLLSGGLGALGTAFGAGGLGALFQRRSPTSSYIPAQGTIPPPY